MSVAKNVKIIVSASLLLTLVSCGNDKKSSPSIQPSQEPLVTSYDWKVVNGRGFPEKAMVEVNNEVLINECHGKQVNRIDRSVLPHVLTVTDMESAPASESVNVKVFECDTDVVVSDDTVGFELNKNGVLGEVVIRI